MGNKHIKGGLTRTGEGYFVGAGRKKGELPPILQRFGCIQCPWAGTNQCPHGIKAGGHHSNWICKERVDQLKFEMERVGSVPRMVQNEEAIKIKMVTDKMLTDWNETGDLDPEFKHLNKNLISLMDKMRKQDEGLKIQGEFNVTHEDFRKAVDLDVKAIREAEFTEEVRTDRQ